MKKNSKTTTTLFKWLRISILCLITHNSLLSTAQSAFKDIGFGARPAGMGNAFTAVANDSNAPLFNAAGIALVSKKELGFSYIKPYMNLENVSLSMMYLSYVHPDQKLGNMGIALTSFDGNGLYVESMCQLSYARKAYTDDSGVYYAGINVKYLSHTFNWDQRTKDAAEQLNDPVVKAGSSKADISADVGILAVFGNKWFVGASARNINTPNLGLKYEDKVPMDTRVGAAYKIPYWKGMDAITCALDVSQRMQEWGKESDKTNIHFGVESWFAVHKYALRAGGNKNEITFGMGLNRRFSGNLAIQVDYALIWSLKITDNMGSHRLGASVKF